MSTDVEHKFELALSLGDLNQALEIARQVDRADKWKLVGDAALTNWNFVMAEECLQKAKDLEGLLVYYGASGNKNGMQSLGKIAKETGKNNIAFVTDLLVGNVDQCIDLLVGTERIPEAALFARTFAPSKMSNLVKDWKSLLEESNKKKAAEALADPADYENLFPDVRYAIIAEQQYKKLKARGPWLAEDYEKYKDSMDWDLLGAVKANPPPGMGVNGGVDEAAEGISRVSIQEQPASPQESPVDSYVDSPVAVSPAAVSPVAASPAAVSPAAGPAATSPSAISPAVVSPPAISPANSTSPKSKDQAPALSEKSRIPPRPASATVAFTLPTPNLLNVGTSASGDDEGLDAFSENMSHMSLEVNTTGTGSLKVLCLKETNMFF